MRPAILALAVTLLLTPQAAAKTWAREVQICGASDCIRLTGDRASRIAQLAKTLEGWSEPLWREELQPAPFYRVFVDRKTRWRWSFLYVPTARAVRIDDRNDASPSFWRTAAPVLRAALAGPVGGLRTFPAPARWPR